MSRYQLNKLIFNYPVSINAMDLSPCGYDQSNRSRVNETRVWHVEFSFIRVWVSCGALSRGEDCCLGFCTVQFYNLKCEGLDEETISAATGL